MSSPSPAERLQIAFDLCDLAEQMLVEKIRRAVPDVSDDEIERRVAEWYQTRPGAEHGDADGVLIAWPRQK